MEKSLETCSGKRCEQIYNKLVEIDGKYDVAKGIFDDGKQNTGDSPRSKSAGNNGTVVTQSKPTCGKTCQERLAEEQRKKEEDEARQFLTILNQNDVPKDIIKEMMSNSGIDLEHNTYAFWKDNVECSGGSCKIYTGNLTDYNNARELERTQGWTNTEIILKRDFYSLGFVLSSEANLQGKTGEIYTSTISGRIEGTRTGVLTFKDLYEANKISKEEYESTKGWSIGYQGAGWSEYIGPVVGGASTYIAGKNGLLTQNNTSNNKEKAWTVDPEMIEDDIKAGVRTNNGYVRNTTAQKLENLVSDASNYIENKHKNGKFMYVIDKDGNIIIGTRDQKNYNRMPHPTLIGGENPEVLSAGMVEIRGGKIYKIDNASGHFKPRAGSLDISQKFFEQLPEKVLSKDFKGYEDYSIKK